MVARAALVFFGGGDRYENDDGILIVPVEDAQSIHSANDVVLIVDWASQTQSVFDQRRVDLAALFRRGGRLILLFGPSASQAWQQPFGAWLSDTLRLAFASGQLDVESKEPQLNNYLHDQVAWGAFSRRTAGLPLVPVAVDPSTDAPVAARFEHQHVDVFAFPIRNTNDAPAAAAILLKAVPARTEYPRYLDAFAIGDEGDLREEQRKAQDRLKTIELTLKSYERMKGILFKTDRDLESEVPSFLTEFLDISTRSEHSNREDFWILDAGNEEAVIGEVKGPGRQHVSRGDVGALMGHRTSADKPDDFPGLLVANVLHKKQTLNERDIPVPDPVTRLGAENAILIMRTLDLFRVLNLKVQGEGGPDILAEARAGGGWLEVDSSGEWTHHGKA